MTLRWNNEHYKLSIDSNTPLQFSRSLFLSQANECPEKNCDPSYPYVCISWPPPDLNRPDIPYRDFKILPPDSHAFDRDENSRDCETALP